MTTTTRAAVIRKAVHLGKAYGRSVGTATVDGVNQLTATGGDANSITDTADVVLSRGASESLNKNEFIYRPDDAAVDQVRTIGALDAAGLAYRHKGPAYTTDPTNATRYLLLKEHPSSWNSALNEALVTECFFVRRDEWTPTDNNRRIYQISAVPISVSDIARKTQIHQIEVHATSDDANEELWRPWDDGAGEWDPYEEAGEIYIDFRHVLPADTQELRLVTTQPFATLADETTTSLVDEEWAAWATLLVMSRWHGRPDNQKDVWTEIGRIASKRVQDRRRQELGRYAFRTVGRNSQFTGMVATGGRAGRGNRSGHGGHRGHAHF